MGNKHGVSSAYDLVAPDYERRFADELRSKPRDRELLDELAARSSGLVLDIGSGPGHIGARIRSAGRPVVALDLSAAMAAAARRRVGSAAVADMVNLPIATASVADIVAFYSVIHLSRFQLHEALVEFSRGLDGDLLHPRRVDRCGRQCASGTRVCGASGIVRERGSHRSPRRPCGEDVDRLDTRANRTPYRPPLRAPWPEQGGSSNERVC